METQTQTFTQTTRFYAQPYDISACGFFFSDADEYDAKRKSCRKTDGSPVEEFEIQFIDGESLDAALFEALGITQGSILAFMDKLDEWDDWQKRNLIIAVGECGYACDISTDDPDDLDVDCYEGVTLEELARQFVDDGLFGEIPDHLASYIDYEAIARDLRHDYTETEIAGETCIYRMA